MLSPLSRAESVGLSSLGICSSSEETPEEAKWGRLAGPKGHDKGVRWLLSEGRGLQKFEAGNQLVITCAFFFFFSAHSGCHKKNGLRRA